MAKLVGISTSPLAQGNNTGISSTGIKSRHGSGYNAVADGTPETATFIIDGQFNPNGAIFRVLLYENDGSRALVAYSDWIDDANIAIDAEETVPVTAVKDVVSSSAYFVCWEQRADSGGQPNMRDSGAVTDANGGSVDDGGATSGYTQDPQVVPDPLPEFDSGTGANQNGIILYFSGTTGPSITSVTDSVGSTADQITEGQDATAQLDQDATVTGAELQNSGGDRVATLPIQSSTSDSVTVQGARGALRYGDTDNKVVLTLDDSSTIEATGITFAAPDNITWVNGTSADTTSDNSFAKGMSSLSSDYQGAFTDPTADDGDPAGIINPVINSDLTVASVEEPGTGTFELYDNTDGTWGSSATYELALDTTVTQVLSTIASKINSNINSPIATSI